MAEVVELVSAVDDGGEGEGRRRVEEGWPVEWSSRAMGRFLCSVTLVGEKGVSGSA